MGFLLPENASIYDELIKIKDPLFIPKLLICKAGACTTKLFTAVIDYVS
jgi:hypothetical protein